MKKIALILWPNKKYWRFEDKNYWLKHGSWLREQMHSRKKNVKDNMVVSEQCCNNAVNRVVLTHGYHCARSRVCAHTGKWALPPWKMHGQRPQVFFLLWTKTDCLPFAEYWVFQNLRIMGLLGVLIVGNAILTNTLREQWGGTRKRGKAPRLVKKNQSSSFLAIRSFCKAAWNI